MVIHHRFGANIVKFGYKNTLSSFGFKGFKCYSHQVSQNVETNKFDRFMDMVALRRAQAARSILVQVQAASSYKELYSYCNSLGDVTDMLHYTEGSEKMHYILVEFANDTDVKNVLSASTHVQDNQAIPVQSQFLWFRASNRQLSKIKQNQNVILSVENGTNIISEENLNSALNQCDSVSAQMQELYMLTRLNDVGLRLRFLSAKQVENTVSGLFPNISAYPFGSSVNGFGKMGCDLDIVLRLTDRNENEESRLVYHCKAAAGTERSTNQRNMETLGDLIHLFLPGCTQVRRILQARVPIIKYYQQLTNVECDLSMTNMSGVYMSDFLYIMGEIDPRVRPFIFTIRKWAKETLITNSSPGRWITNFSLTLLALAFLQNPLYSPPVLPTLNTLVKLADKGEQFVTEDGINGTFLRDITRLQFKKENNQSLQNLLFEFFEFYAQFDFNNRAICLNEAVSIMKPEHSALYIVNPLERGLNVSKNVSFEELERVKVEIRNAAWMLESCENNSNDKGILRLFENKKASNKYKLQFSFSNKKSRLMDITNIFEEKAENNNIDYKDPQVEKQVKKIKKEGKQNITALQMNQRHRKSKR